MHGLEKPASSPSSILKPEKLLYVEHVFCHLAIEVGISDVQLFNVKALNCLDGHQDLKMVNLDTGA